jgi:hypothetical protein
LEIILPNAEWAAEKIVGGEMDMHVLNVMLGGAETDEDMKDDGLTWNIHKFLYTPTLAKTLAEGAGFKDVEVEDYKTDPGVGYHMKVTGIKPELRSVEDVKTDAEEANVEANGLIHDRFAYLRTQSHEPYALNTELQVDK